MQRLAVLVGSLACIVAALAGGLSIGHATTAASAAATCTYEQKQARTAALKRAQAASTARRAAYFTRTKSRTKRAAFVKRENAKLKPLRSAAACTVPPLPPSSSASCSFMISPNPRARVLGIGPGGRRYGYASLYEGPHDPSDHTPSLGRVPGIMLMIDFPDAPGEGQAAGQASAYALDLKYFEEVSYGRFSPTLDVHPTWVRMPEPTAFYLFPSGGLLEAADRFYTDAITAADPEVDFSRYRFVIVVPTRRASAGVSTNGAWGRLPGYGARTAEGEIRFAVSLTWDISRFGASVPNHEFLHTLGLPDTRFGDGSPGEWDAMGDRAGGGNATTHLFGWHKWKLGWLDPAQLTCLSGAGQIEETLTSLATRGGKKLVVVPTSPSTAYVLEARTRVGYDRAICEEGVLVYDVDSDILQAETKNGRGVIRVHGPRRCQRNSAGALRTGETFEDAAIKVEVLGRSAGAFRVRMTKK